jgi:hypothetical protein
MSFGYDENVKLDDRSANHSSTSAANLSPNLSNSTYESEIMDLDKKVDYYKEEITNMAEKMDPMHNMIQKSCHSSIQLNQARRIRNNLNL